MIAVSTSRTKLLTTVVNAAPITMPTARSTTLPRLMNSLNSLMNPGMAAPSVLAVVAREYHRTLASEPGSAGVGGVAVGEVGPDRLAGLAEVQDHHRRGGADTGAALPVEDRGRGGHPAIGTVDEAGLDPIRATQPHRPLEPGRGLAGVGE